MTKKAAPIPTRHVLWFSWKLVTFFCIAFSLVALFRLHSQYDISSSVISRSRSRIRYDSFDGPPKIAFLFLARRDLPLDFLWGSFFEVCENENFLFRFFCFGNFLAVPGKMSWIGLLQNVDAAKFSIYIHSAPGFVFGESTTRSKFFYDRQLSNSIQVMIINKKKQPCTF